MMTPAFSTVACPEWTLPRVAAEAARAGFLGVELRTFGAGSRRFACDPALTDPGKVARLFREQGVAVVSLATGERFDRRVFPPLLGHVFGDNEGAVRAAKRAIDLAAASQCPLVRVFAFQAPAGEKVGKAARRVVGRLEMVVDHADRSGVKIMLENGGSWSSAAALMELVSAVDSPLLGACYNVAVGADARDEPTEALALLRDKLLAVRLMDWYDQRPVALGTGRMPVRAWVRLLADANFQGPAIFEWDRAWTAGMEPAEAALPLAARTMFGWLGEGAGAGATTPHATAGV